MLTRWKELKKQLYIYILFALCFMEFHKACMFVIWKLFFGLTNSCESLALVTRFPSRYTKKLCNQLNFEHLFVSSF
jgi:hypothetical protein